MLWSPGLDLLEADHLGRPGPAGGGGLAGTGCSNGVPGGVELLRYLGAWTVPVPDRKEL